ncbi:MAG: amidohydrolase family protein [Balneolaceae bacterium]
MAFIIKTLAVCVAVCSFLPAILFADPLVIKNVKVLTMETDQVLEGQTVIISDGIVNWIGDDREADIPEGAEIITGDYYVMPGLAEMHAHIPSSQGGEEQMHDVLKLYLSQGITTIRGMLGDPAHLELRRKAANGEIVSPRIFTSGPSFNGNSAADPETARNAVREQAEAGYDLLKFHPGIPLESFEAITDEAAVQGIEFSGHISAEVGLERSLAAGKGSIDHLDRYMEFLAGDAAQREDPPIIYFGYDLTPYVEEDKIEEAAIITKKAGVWNVPTNTLLENVFNPDNTVEEMQNWPGMEFIPGNTVANWSGAVDQIRSSDIYNEDQARAFLDIRKRLTLALHQHEAGILLGADAPQIFNPPGFAAHRELALLAEAGLTPFEALKTGTVHVGKYLDEENTTGKVAEGYRADLILLSENPLESIPFQEYIEGVIYQGKYLNRAQLDSLLEGLRQNVN